MNFSIKILFVIFCFYGFKTKAQDINRQKLIENLKADKESLFVINGIPYSFSDSLKLDQELKKIENNKISEIAILKNDGKISHQRNDVIIIQFATELSQKAIKEKLREIMPKFKDKYYGYSQHIYSDAKDPVLFLNGTKIQHTETQEKIKNLNRNEIAYIHFSQTPQSEEYHGQNAKNGIVIIWTKEKLNETN